MKVQLSFPVRFIVLSGIFLSGCRTAHNVAVASFRVIDAPANYVRRHIDEEGTTTSTTATTSQSDVTAPGQPIVASPPPQRRMTAQHRTGSETERERSAAIHDTEEPTSRPASSQHTATSTQGAKIPYAKPVPGKPGYVYSPFDPNGGYVDVTGYAAGSKAKDPYSGKIFIVP
jgi:hypothetical protein